MILTSKHERTHLFSDEKNFIISIDTDIENIESEKGYIGIFMKNEDYEIHGWDDKKSFYLFEKVKSEKKETPQPPTLFVNSKGETIEIDYKTVWHTEEGVKMDGYEKKYLGRLMRKETFDEKGWNMLNTFSIYIFTKPENKKTELEKITNDVGLEVANIIMKFGLSYNSGNVIMNILLSKRTDKTNHIKDLLLAKHYLESEIKFLQDDEQW